MTRGYRVLFYVMLFIIIVETMMVLAFGDSNYIKFKTVEDATSLNQIMTEANRKLHNDNIALGQSMEKYCPKGVVLKLY